VALPVNTFGFFQLSAIKVCRTCSRTASLIDECYTRAHAYFAIAFTGVGKRSAIVFISAYGASTITFTSEDERQGHQQLLHTHPSCGQ
jgi:hypothetical protein